jgi:hypothetical protein
MAKRSTNPGWLKIQAQRGAREDSDTLRLRKIDPKSDSPVFFVEIVIGQQMGSPVQRLSRATPWDLSYSAPAGRYACFPAWDWKEELLPSQETEIAVSRKFLEQVQEAFRSGVIPDGTLEELLELLAKKP